MENNYNMSEPEVLGSCPLCGEGIIESEKSFGCSAWKNGCKYSIWKNDRFLESIGKVPDKTMVREILTKGKYFAKNLKSKRTGKDFEATLSYAKDEESGYFKWNMEFPEAK